MSRRAPTVFAALGFYPAIPGTDVLALHGPLFLTATLNLGDGRALTITGGATGTARAFVQGASLNGQALSRSFIRYADLAAARNVLAFGIGASPHSSWASGPDEVPPSYPAGAVTHRRTWPSTGRSRPLRGSAARLSVPSTRWTASPSRTCPGTRTSGARAWWPSPASPTWLEVDLGAEAPVTGFLVTHAGARG